MTLQRKAFVGQTAAASLAALAVVRGAASAQTVPTLRAITFPSDAAKQVLYAMQAGIYRKHGVNVELSQMGGGAAMIAAVVGGSAELGAANLFSLFSAYGHGIPMRIVAPIALYDTNHADVWLLVRKDSPYHAAADLNGKVMAADSPTSIVATATRVWMDQHGGDGKSIRVLGLSATNQLVALEEGRVDMVMVKPPYLTLAVQSGNVRVLGKPFDAVAPHFLDSCWVATTDYIAKNPENIKAFVAGCVESARYINRNQDATIAMVAQFTKQDPAQIKAGIREIIPETISLADVQKPLEFAYKYGIIDRQYDARGILSPFVPMSGSDSTRGKGVGGR